VEEQVKENAQRDDVESHLAKKNSKKIQNRERE